MGFGTRYTLLQGHTITYDASYLVFKRLLTPPCVSPTCYADNDTFFVTYPQDS